MAVVCLAVACSKNINNPIKSKQREHSTAVNRYRFNELIVMYKTTPTPAAANLIKKRILSRRNDIDFDSLRIRVCNECDGYVELWSVKNVHRIVTDTTNAGTLTGRASTGASDDELAYLSANYFSKPPLDTPMNWNSSSYETIKISGEGKDTITVAVLDTGIDTKRVSLNLLWKNTDENTNGKDDDANCYVDDTHGWNFVGNNENVTEDSPNLHGTLVSHYIINEFITEGERSPRNFVQIMSLKTHDSTGRGDLFSSICALHYAINKGANIINASWGFYHYTKGSPHPYLDKLITKTMREKGILFVAAAGNRDEGADSFVKTAYEDLYDSEIPEDMLRNLECHSFYPACLSRKGKNVITVTTTDGKDVSSTQNYSEKYVDVGVMRDVDHGNEMKFNTPFVGPAAVIGGSSFATAIACGKIGAYFPKSMFLPNLDKDAVFEQLMAAPPPAGSPPLITFEPVMEKTLIRQGKNTYPK